jgi:hypothetical protein
MKVHIYSGTSTSTGYLAELTASGTGNSQIASQCGGDGNRTFSYPIPGSMIDGSTKRFSVWGINIPAGDNPQLSGSPLSLNTSTCFNCTEAAVYVNKSGTWTKINKSDIPKEVKIGETIRLGAKVTAGLSVKFDVKINNQPVTGLTDVPANGKMLTNVFYRNIKINTPGDYSFVARIVSSGPDIATIQ